MLRIVPDESKEEEEEEEDRTLPQKGSVTTCRREHNYYVNTDIHPTVVCGWG